MRRNCATKIVATLGPATSDPATIEALFRAGADVFRLNFSHGAPEDHRKRYDALREVEKRTGRPVAILADLQGPKLRVGTFKDGPVKLQKGQKFRFELAKGDGNADRVTLPHPEIFAALSPGQDLLVDDGRVRLRALETSLEHALCEVIVAGTISDRKGVNVPGTVLPISALTDKDRRDLAFALELGVDWVALSFVQRPDDIAEAKKLIQGRAGVCAKLEKPSAIDRLDEIVELTDAVMVARGDLGVEMPPEDVPTLQKRIVRSCRRFGRPVIVATQMLDSMIHAPTPTRAEASDVATAVYDGADGRDAVCRQTASGDYPLEAVEMMGRIIARVERDPSYRPIMDADHAKPEATRVGRDHGGGRASRGDDQGGGDRHLHHLGFHHVARGARAAGSADPVPDAKPAHGTAHGAVLGHALRGVGGIFGVRPHGRKGRQRGPRGRFRRSRRDHRDHRRRALRHAGGDQYLTYRLGVSPLSLRRGGRAASTRSCRVPSCDRP